MVCARQAMNSSSATHAWGAGYRLLTSFIYKMGIPIPKAQEYIKWDGICKESNKYCRPGKWQWSLSLLLMSSQLLCHAIKPNQRKGYDYRTALTSESCLQTHIECECLRSQLSPYSKKSLASVITLILYMTDSMKQFLFKVLLCIHFFFHMKSSALPFLNFYLLS